MIHLVLSLVIPTLVVLSVFISGMFVGKRMHQSPSIISTSFHIAKKNYYCDVCDDIIEKGEHYQRVFLSENNKPLVHRVHEYCQLP